MKKAIVTVLALVFLVAAPVQAFGFMSVIGPDVPTHGTLNVDGNGIVIADPDIARATVGVEINASTAREAQTVAAETMAAVLEAIKALGIDEADIQTNLFFISPRHDHRMDARTGNWEQILIGYQLIHTLNVTIHDIDMIGELIYAASSAGANRASNVTFDVSNREELYLEALEMAIADGLRKANVMARALNISIGAPTAVRENTVFAPFARSVMVESAVFSFDMGMGAAPIQSGQIEITAGVSLTFMYEIE